MTTAYGLDIPTTLSTICRPERMTILIYDMQVGIVSQIGDNCARFQRKDCMNKYTDDERLLRLHRLHLGLYARVAKKLNVTQSYVSHVANGRRRNDKIMAALLRELDRLSKLENSIRV